MHAQLAQFDDLEVVSGELGDPSLFRLTGIVRNEMHFLPAFLPHYRKLGVGQFIFVDDRSNDGTSEFLASQPDVLVLRSNFRFGDLIDGDAIDAALPKVTRRANAWRMILQAKYATDVFALHLDIDEFLDLPNGMTLQELAQRAQADGVDAIWAVMIDVYPKAVSDLAHMQVEGTVDLDGEWYFDAVPHIKPRRIKAARTLYGGSRARLFIKYGLHGRATWFDRSIAPYFGLPPPRINAIRKPVFCRWRDQTLMLSSHAVTLEASDKIVLPLRHFKFCAASVAHFKTAISEDMYFKNAADYKSLDALLGAMIRENGQFTFRKSKPWDGYEGCAKAGAAMGL